MAEKVNVMLYGDGRSHANHAEEVWCELGRCPLRDSGKCACVSRALVRTGCPYGKLRTIRGYTRRAMRFDEFCSRHRNDPVYGALSSHIDGTLLELVGDYVAMRLPMVAVVEADERPYQGEEVAEGVYVVNGFTFPDVSWVHRDRLGPEAFDRICKFRLMPLVGYEEIREHRTKTVPDLVEQLRIKWPEMHEALVAIDHGLAELEIDYTGRTAVLATLRDGSEIMDGGNRFVKVGSRLTCEEYRGIRVGGNGWKSTEHPCRVEFEIDDGMTVKVTDGGWVDPETTLFV